jgi:hypothetical protein
MNLPHIDNNFYKLTPHQAKTLVVGGVLPKHGYERQACRIKLKSVTLGRLRAGRFQAFLDTFATESHTAWIIRTPLRWWNGEEVKEGWTWALHCHFSSMPLILRYGR